MRLNLSILKNNCHFNGDEIFFRIDKRAFKVSGWPLEKVIQTGMKKE